MKKSLLVSLVGIIVIFAGVLYITNRPTENMSFDFEEARSEELFVNEEYQNIDNQVQPVDTGKQLCTTTTSPWVKIVSPNGGENYPIGSQLTVTWDSCNYAGAVFLELYRVDNGSSVGAISLVDSIDGTVNDGNETIMLSTQIQPTILSGNYELRIFGGGLFDASDDTFVIFN